MTPIEWMNENHVTVHRDYAGKWIAFDGNGIELSGNSIHDLRPRRDGLIIIHIPSLKTQEWERGKSKVRGSSLRWPSRKRGGGE